MEARREVLFQNVGKGLFVVLMRWKIWMRIQSRPTLPIEYEGEHISIPTREVSERR